MLCNQVDYCRVARHSGVPGMAFGRKRMTRLKRTGLIARLVPWAVRPMSIDYSARKASTGLTDAARCAGM